MLILSSATELILPGYGNKIIAIPLVFLGYSVGFQCSFYQATLGKKLFRIKVVGKTQKITIFHASMRALCQIGFVIVVPILFFVSLSGLEMLNPIRPSMYEVVYVVGPLLVIIMFISPYLLILFTKERTALHDLICGTRVVQA